MTVKGRLKRFYVPMSEAAFGLECRAPHLRVREWWSNPDPVV